MCGRFTIGAPTEELISHFGLDDRAKEVWQSLTPRYNVAPTQRVPVVRLEGAEGGESRRVLAPMRWGLVPGWAEDSKIGNRLINARLESVATKPAFRSAFKRRRCLIPATGFFEWSSPAKGKKQPWLIRLRGGAVFAFAGLWESWVSPEQTALLPAPPLESFTILTGPPNELAARVHDRMPVILAESSYEAWLDTSTPKDRLEQLMSPFPATAMESFEVGTVVNNPRNEDPACIQPLA